MHQNYFHCKSVELKTNYMKLLIFVFVILAFESCIQREPTKTGFEGKPLPSFNLLFPDSITYFNTSHLPLDKPVALFFFSPHCPFCRAQMTEIIDDINKLKGIQFCLVTTYSLSEMKKFYYEYKLAKYPNILIGQDTANFIADYFEAPWVPFMAIYGKDKKLNKAFTGKIYGKQIIEATAD